MLLHSLYFCSKYLFSYWRVIFIFRAVESFHEIWSFSSKRQSILYLPFFMIKIDLFIFSADEWVFFSCQLDVCFQFFFEILDYITFIRWKKLKTCVDSIFREKKTNVEMKFVQNNSYTQISFTIYVLHIQSSQLKFSHKLVVNIHFIFVSHFTCIIQVNNSMWQKVFN